MSELKKLRVSKNLTQQQVADMFGVSQKTIEYVVKYLRYKEVI